MVEQCKAPEGSNIIRDEVIILCAQQDTGPQAQLRRVEVWVEEKQQTMVFVTNHLELAASTIAAVYKERWASSSLMSGNLPRIMNML